MFQPAAVTMAAKLARYRFQPIPACRPYSTPTPGSSPSRQMTWKRRRRRPRRALHHSRRAGRERSSARCRGTCWAAPPPRRRPWPAAQASPAGRPAGAAPACPPPRRRRPPARNAPPAPTTAARWPAAPPPPRPASAFIRGTVFRDNRRPRRKRSRTSRLGAAAEIPHPRPSASICG